MLALRGPLPRRRALAEGRYVVGAAIVRRGRVLAARRSGPGGLQGRWELPGGKLEPGESLRDAAVREVREELGCDIAVTRYLDGEQPIGDTYRLRVAVAVLNRGEPVPHEHDAIRWLAPDELYEVSWLAPDLPFLPQLRELLLSGEPQMGA